MKRLALAAYVVALHAVVAAALVTSDFVEKTAARLGLVEPSRTLILLTQRRLQERMDPSVPDGSAIFLGTSITFGLAVAAVGDRTVNFGIGSQTARQLADSITGYRSLARARVVFLEIGANDVGTKRFAGLPHELERIVAGIPGNVPLVWSGVMPRATIRGDVSAANAVIQTLCARRTNCRYVDTVSAMTGRDGTLRPDIYLDDGIHPSVNGYKIWISALRQNAVPIGVNARRPSRAD